MTVRTWGRIVLTALAGSALVGAGQLGVAYGLGIVDLNRSFGADSGNQWNAQLAWVGWFAVLSAVAGAAVAERAARRHRHAAGIGTRVLLALFGGVGAGAVIPLSVQPARSAHLAQSVNPALVVGLAAGLGAVGGILVAVVALSLRPLAWNLAAVSSAAWLAGLAEAGRYPRPDGADSSIRLGLPQWTVRAGETDRLVEMLGMPVLALLAGLVVALVARARRQPGLAVAVSGMAGPVPLALAYLIAGPGTYGDTADQMAPYLGALIAVPAGLLGSLLVAVVPRRDRARDRSQVPAGGPTRPAAGGATRPADTVEPTNILPPLGKRDEQRRPPAAQRPAGTIPSQRARASAAPRRDDHVEWVAGLGGAAQGGSLPRRVPGERFPAGA